MSNEKRGNYFGTEIDHAWYKRFRHDGFFARGNGKLWFDDEGLFFLRRLTKTPLLIGWNEMRTASLGRWHAGRWGAGRPILKIDFRRHEMDLSAGFMLSKDWDEMEELAADLRRKVAGG